MNLRSLYGVTMVNPLKAQEQWPSLARDMAMLTMPDSPAKDLDNVCVTYGLSRAELKTIINVPYFRQLFARSLKDIQSLDSKGAARYRAMLLSQALAEQMFGKASRGEMDVKDTLKLLELLFKAAGMDKDAAGAQVNTQVNIALPIPQGVAKVAHCIPVEA